MGNTCGRLEKNEESSVIRLPTLVETLMDDDAGILSS
jgi:hypothetical protein